MFIRFIESAVEKFPAVTTGEFVDVATCFYRRQHVAANSDGAVV
jgi:hypothetical protein